MYPSNNWLFLKPNTYITSSLQLLGHHIVKFTEKYYSFQEFNVQVNHHHIYRVWEEAPLEPRVFPALVYNLVTSSHLLICRFYGAVAINIITIKAAIKMWSGFSKKPWEAHALRWFVMAGLLSG